MNNLENIEVYYYGEYYQEHSKIYYVDPNRDRFLVIDSDRYFKWVNTEDCRSTKEED